jgi:hypothetical protein
MFLAEMRIPFQALPAAKLLHCPKISPSHYEPACKRMPECMRRNVGKISTTAGSCKGSFKAFVLFQGRLPHFLLPFRVINTQGPGVLALSFFKICTATELKRTVRVLPFFAKWSSAGHTASEKDWCENSMGCPWENKGNLGEN